MLITLKFIVIIAFNALLLPVVLAACFFVPFDCDPSRDPELDKPLFEDPRGREMDLSTAKTILPVSRSDWVKPSEVGLE
jgi:hypothetical protein